MENAQRGELQHIYVRLSLVGDHDIDLPRRCRQDVVVEHTLELWQLLAAKQIRGERGPEGSRKGDGKPRGDLSVRAEATPLKATGVEVAV